MNPTRNLKDQRFDRLTVIERAGSCPRGNVLWRCRCDCGNEKIARGDALRRRDTKSCGCLQAELQQKFGNKHRSGLAKAGAALRAKAAARALWMRKPASVTHGPLTEAETTAIAAAISAGKVTRIKNGEWPDAGRLYEIKQEFRKSRARGSQRGGATGAMMRRLAVVGSRA